MAAYRAIADDAWRIAAPHAHLIAEIGIGQDDAVATLFASAGLGEIKRTPDLSGITRVIAAVRQP
jgi:release factor glutamine methyltransferase